MLSKSKFNNSQKLAYTTLEEPTVKRDALSEIGLLMTF